MNKYTKPRRFRTGDTVRIGGHPNAQQHLSELRIPVSLLGCYGTIQQVGDVGVSFASSAIPDREWHIPMQRVYEVLQLHEANKTFERPDLVAV